MHCLVTFTRFPFLFFNARLCSSLQYHQTRVHTNCTGFPNTFQSCFKHILNLECCKCQKKKETKNPFVCTLSLLTRHSVIKPRANNNTAFRSALGFVIFLGHTVQGLTYLLLSNKMVFDRVLLTELEILLLISPLANGSVPGKGLFFVLFLYPCSICVVCSHNRCIRRCIGRAQGTHKTAKERRSTRKQSFTFTCTCTCTCTCSKQMSERRNVVLEWAAKATAAIVKPGLPEDLAARAVHDSTSRRSADVFAGPASGVVPLTVPGSVQVPVSVTSMMDASRLPWDSMVSPVQTSTPGSGPGFGPGHGFEVPKPRGLNRVLSTLSMSGSKSDAATLGLFSEGPRQAQIIREANVPSVDSKAPGASPGARPHKLKLTGEVVQAWDAWQSTAGGYADAGGYANAGGYADAGETSPREGSPGDGSRAAACPQVSSFQRELWQRGGTTADIHEVRCVTAVLRAGGFGSAPMTTFEALGGTCPAYLDPMSWLYVQYATGRVACARAEAGEPIESLGAAAPARSLTGFKTLPHAPPGLCPSGITVCRLCDVLGHTEFEHTGPDAGPVPDPKVEAGLRAEVLQCLQEVNVPGNPKLAPKPVAPKPVVPKPLAPKPKLVPAKSAETATPAGKAVVATKPDPKKRAVSRLATIAKRNEKAAKKTKTFVF